MSSCTTRLLYEFMHGSRIKPDSCYDIWERLGNTGEAAFLEFLKSGKKGDTGLSAYEYWKSQSENTGKTFDQFIANIKGPTGDPGSNGKNGVYPDIPINSLLFNDGNSKKILVVKDGIVTILDYAELIIVTPPNKTDYTDTELFDPTGMVVQVKDNNGTTTITNYEYDKYVTTGSNTHEIRYIKNGITLRAYININTLSLIDALEDFYYTYGTDGIYHIYGWKQTYHKIPSTQCILPNNDKVEI